MTDYEPLDLSPFCNAGVEISWNNRRPAIGNQAFHGLPFQIGNDPTKPCFLAFGGDAPWNAGAVTVPINQTARRLVFAHTMPETRMHEGETRGLPVATYVVHFSVGECIEIPIREWYEIATTAVNWGDLPFLSVPDHADAMRERYAGPWGDVGYRQTEVQQASIHDYYLWAWENPNPEKVITSIEIVPVPGALRFLIAGITLSHVDEEPFRRSAAVPVQITLANPEDVAGPFNLEVMVDRGVATYPYALPEMSAEEFLAHDHTGYGEMQNQGNSPAYVEVAAIPSATVSVKKNSEEIGSAKWGDLETKGVIETERMRIEVVDTGRNWVHTTVLDDETGKPVPCRVHFRSPNGIPYAPHGHHPHVNSNLGTWHIDVGGDVRLGQISYAYIDGKCQGWLPRGEVIVDVARGFEYEPIRSKVEIQPGQRELTLRLKRVRNMNKERYFSGDTHVHFLSTQGALTEASGEDLDVVNLLLSQWGSLFTNTEEFSGHPSIARDGETIVYATQENRQHLLGHLTLLGLKEPVMPWCSDGPAEAEMGGNLEITLSHWADMCHAQGGTVVIPHLPNPNGEPAALIATGRADAVEMLTQTSFNHMEYYRYLNGGYRLPLAGGTDKMSSDVPVGLYRTYAHIPEDQPFNYDTWCAALRGGNTFLSGGPLINFTVDGQPIGSTLTLGKDGGTVEVEAVVTSILPIYTLEIVQGGVVVAATSEERGTKELRLRTKLKIDRSSWLCARSGGPNYTRNPHYDCWWRGIMAHTSPIYLACGGAYDVYSAETMHYMLTLIDGSLQYIKQRAPQWRPGTVTHHHNHEDHQEFLESPFHEAAAAVHKLMHQHGIAH